MSEPNNQRTAPADASVIPPAIQTRVASANAGECWLCGLHGTHVTRVVTTADLPLLREFQRRGLTQLTDLNAFENLVFLCTACNVAFNNPAVIWTFLPASLDTFIAAEESFQARRQSSASQGLSLPRPPTATAIPSTLYSRYQIRSRHLFTRIFTDNPTREWPGSPLAAIIRGARIVSGFERLPVDEGGIPMDVALKLQQLLLLFGTAEPRLVVQPQVAPATVSGNTSQSQAVIRVRAEPTRPAGDNHNRPESPPHAGGSIPNASADSTQDLAFVGRAFNSALQQIRDDSRNQDRTAEAHAWLTTEIRSIVSKLRMELRILHDGNDNHLLLPEYAINPAVSLKLSSSTIPSVLVKYKTQFSDCLIQLFQACDLNAKCEFTGMWRAAFLYDINFPPGDAQTASQNFGNRLFDPEFENEFMSSIQALTIEPK
ncbi:hypothetical protein Q9L58_006561 [Maublancomyces gigas]|uniref:HNH endonuclease n=1 Tax=Discina gigas TaxID=1032678 RepID=A0ABR3GFL4_9PEZI